MNNEIEKQNILNNINRLLQKIESIKQKELSVINKFYSYENFNSMFSNSLLKEDYLKLHDEIEKLDLKLLKQKLNKIKELLNTHLTNCTLFWSKYNSSYITHLKNKLNTLNNMLNKSNPYIVETDNPQTLIANYLSFYNNINNINTNLEIMDHFSFIDKNYVIFGKNGAGKTRLLNYIKSNYLNSNSYIIPSDREIRFGNLLYLNMDYQKRFPLSNLFTNSNSSAYPNDVLTLLLKDKMFKELQNTNDLIESGTTRISKTFYKFREIFNNLSLNRKIKLDGNQLFLYNDELNINPYYIKDGSDGEKSIVQLILFVLLCPQNSFIFIDEPESHFNTALLNELFNLLEKERKDIVFIYCTHNVDFIELRDNAQLIYLESFDGNNWKIEEINSFDEISIENLINIVGTKKDIVFIESEKEKLDYKFYTALFPNFKIIPVSSCEKVIDSCKSLNDFNFLNLNRKAYGIIDNDFRTPEEISRYNQSKIFTLPYSEIENLLLSPIILEYICNKYELNDKLDSLKEDIIHTATNDKDGIILDYLNKTYSKFQKKGHISSINIENIKSEIDLINNDNKDKFIDILQKFIENLEKDLLNQNYDKIICKYPNKGFIKSLNKLGINKDIYFSWIIKSISSDSEFRNQIITNIFNNFFE